VKRFDFADFETRKGFAAVGGFTAALICACASAILGWSAFAFMQ
jgi:hypothetical protein